MRFGGYYTLDGARLPSVTTILRVLDKPALPRWAARLVAEEAHALVLASADNGRSARQVLDDLDVARLAGAPWRTSQHAAERGRGVHELAAALGRGETVRPETVPAELVPYLAAVREFAAETSYRAEWSERTVYGDGYAGTLDAVAHANVQGTRADKRPWLVDFKTTTAAEKAKVWPEHRLQLAAYRAADFALADDGAREPLPRTRGGLVVHVWPGGWRATPVPAGREDYRAFRRVLDVWRWLHPRAAEADNNGTKEAA